MENNRFQDQRYIRAKQKVEKISKFYRHLSIYIIVNIILSTIFIYNDIEAGDSFEQAFFNTGNFKVWFFWGIAVIFQAIGTFGFPFMLSKDWEERKINEYLNEQNKR